MEADRGKKKARITMDISEGEINMDDGSGSDGYHTDLQPNNEHT